LNVSFGIFSFLKIILIKGFWNLCALKLVHGHVHLFTLF
jgi:hypothetical protein